MHRAMADESVSAPLLRTNQSSWMAWQSTRLGSDGVVLRIVGDLFVGAAALEEEIDSKRRSSIAGCAGSILISPNKPKRDELSFAKEAD